MVLVTNTESAITGGVIDADQDTVSVVGTMRAPVPSIRMGIVASDMMTLAVVSVAVSVVPELVGRPSDITVPVPIVLVPVLTPPLLVSIGVSDPGASITVSGMTEGVAVSVVIKRIPESTIIGAIVVAPELTGSTVVIASIIPDEVVSVAVVFDPVATIPVAVALTIGVGTTQISSTTLRSIITTPFVEVLYVY